jgi:hypothetical protein
MKQLIIFDLDGTLAPSKSSLDTEMSSLLHDLLEVVNKTVVTRYRISLEQKHYAPTTINLRLAAVRRLAYKAADCGLLSADLAAGIRRVKGAKRLEVPVGNWLSAEQG